MEEERRRKLILNMVSFHIVFQKEILDLFYDNNNSELSPLLFKALHEIHLSDGITPSILSKRLSLSTSNNSRCLQKLTERGYIVKIKDETDKRITHIKLSEKGSSLVEYSIKLMDEVLLKKFTVLSSEELMKLSVGFSVLRDLFEKMEMLNSVELEKDWLSKKIANN